jgi:hypothetical protein
MRPATIIALIGVSSLGLPLPAFAESAPKPGQTLAGRIKKFECGDNCYLTITTPTGDVDGLCSAKVCVPWFENQKMPSRMIGKKVVVTTGMDKQVDGNYDVVGRYLSFKKITFVK